MSQHKPVTQTYHILDKGMRYVGAQRLKPGQKTVIATDAEAKFFIENGGLSLADPAETAKAIKEAQSAPEPQEPETGEDPGAALVSDETAVVADKAGAAKPHAHKAR